MTLYGKFVCFILIYLISDSKWVLVESSENTQPSGTTETSGSDGSSATTPPSLGGDGSTVKTDQNDGGIKLFGNDSKNPNETVELNTEQYDLKELTGNRIDYELKSEVKCTSITVDGVELWKHGDHKCDDDPKSVSYRHGDTIVIHLGKGFVQYRKSNNTWNVEFENNLQTSGDNTSDPSSQAQYETRTSGGGGGTGSGGSGTRTSGEGGDGQGGSTSPPANEGSGTHKGANEGKGTGGEGGDGSSHLSSGGPTSHGTGLTSGPDGSTATQTGSSGGDGTSATPGQGATATSPTAGNTEPESKTGVELSLKATAATNEFDHNKVGNIVTYTAKANYGFKSVKTGKKGDIVVWSTTNASEYATKVVLNGKGKKQKEVTIYLPNGTTKIFEKDKNNPWSEVSQNSTQATGQPASGTPASGSQGITGGHSMTYGSSGPMTGNGYGTTGGEDMTGGGYGKSFGTDPNEHGMKGGHGGRDRCVSSYNPKDGDVTSGHSGTKADEKPETEEDEDEEDVEDVEDENET